jgi:hypothetical protein
MHVVSSQPLHNYECAAGGNPSLVISDLRRVSYLALNQLVGNFLNIKRGETEGPAIHCFDLFSGMFRNFQDRGTVKSDRYARPNLENSKATE